MTLPDGIYTTTFLGILEYDMTLDGSIYQDKPGRPPEARLKWWWEFLISSGPYAGKVVGYRSGAISSQPRCGHMISMLSRAVDGKRPVGDFVAKSFENKSVRVFVQDNAVTYITSPRPRARFG
jgi:hypothetical protein